MLEFIWDAFNCNDDEQKQTDWEQKMLKLMGGGGGI